jgi:hypothetical protein
VRFANTGPPEPGLTPLVFFVLIEHVQDRSTRVSRARRGASVSVVRASRLTPVAFTRDARRRHTSLRKSDESGVHSTAKPGAPPSNTGPTGTPLCWQTRTTPSSAVERRRRLGSPLRPVTPEVAGSSSGVPVKYLQICIFCLRPRMSASSSILATASRDSTAQRRAWISRFRHPVSERSTTGSWKTTLLTLGAARGSVATSKPPSRALPGGRLDRRRQHSDGGRLASPVRAEQGENLPAATSKSMPFTASTPPG